MALTYGDREVRPLTAGEVLRMLEAGILSEEEPVELLHGVLTAMSPKSPAHEEVKTRLVEWLAPGVAARRFALRIEGPLAVPDRTSLPEPDLAVVRRADHAERHPSHALLVIEVASISVRIDTQVKPALYAQAGIPEYWVVDLPARCVHAFTQPRGAAYEVRHSARSGDRLTPRQIEIAPLEVAALLAEV